jgi:predicted Zn-dependent peptidase
MKLFSRLVLMATIAVAGVTFSFSQTASPESQISEFDVNGMKVLIKRRAGTPTVAAGLFFRGGVRNMTAENAGIEGFMLSAATESSKNFPLQTLRKETSKIGTAIGSSSTYDYSVLSMASTKPNFEKSWQMFVDVAINPTFAPDVVERTREGILTGLRTQSDSPEGSLEQSVEKVVYAGHPYAVGPEGTIEIISKLTPADLAAYHKKLLQTSRMLLVVVGDIEPSTLQKKIAASFAGLPRGDYKYDPLPPIKFAEASVDVTTKSVQTDYVKGTFLAPSLSDPDYFAMRTAISILQSRVYQEVRVKRNLSYAPDAELYGLAANTAAISVTSVNPNEAVKVMLDEIQKLKQGDVDQDTIGQMAGYFLTTYYLKQETNAAQAAELAQYEMFGGGWRKSLEFLDKIRAVKAADIQAVANKYMKNVRFVVVGNPADINRSIFLKS